MPFPPKDITLLYYSGNCTTQQKATISYTDEKKLSSAPIPSVLSVLISFYTARAMETADRERLRKANYDILQNSKEERVKKRHKKCTLEDTLAEERKNPSYEAGMH
ncbi:UNVERIFIED_CONTAM: hypothetical protein NCL1_20119 [Trichonephila clavipes]